MKMGHGGARKGAGKPKGVKWPSTLAKEQAREALRQEITAHIQPIARSLIAAAIGTSKLMLRNEDGTWRAATSTDDIEKWMNGDPNRFYIAPNPPNVQASTLSLAYAVDKPKEQEQDINLHGDLTLIDRLDVGLRRAGATRKPSKG